ncbi:hypothetical protein CMI39_00920 [Candidatus Pacearchaeota archaeon]|jgi:radical SAM superfamily enzyme YgiQ (UPF0313 family)|nr:hypothetical protein [Candidatus Pacearchaeota archaeon]|tara:strand:+ start:7376 stop:8986 length:1611 start_codon:yes stop_codon:yes gene_type:complete
MQILLIIPRYNLTNKADYQYVFPLGLGYISSVLKKEKYNVDCLNLNHFNGKIEDLITKKLNHKKYDFVCTGHIGIGYAIVEKIINTVKNHNSQPKVIFGGPLITSEPKLVFENLKPDFAILGEGEITIIELLKAIVKNKDLKNVNGIIYKDENGKTIFTKQREPIKNIDSLPAPDFEGLEFEKKLDNECNNSNIYNLFNFPRTYPILSSRGCPFQCTFCYHTLGRKYRMRSIKNVMDELKIAVKKYKINIIEIIDDMFSIDKKRLYEFCKHLKKLVNETPWECKWECQLSVNTVDKEMLTILKDSGCHAISFGFESYSQTVLKSMKKPITSSQINEALKLSMERGLSVQGNFIFGDSAETKETAKETLDYWKKYSRGQIKLGFIQPYPGSEIYNRCIKKGIIKDKLFFIKNKISHTNWLNMTDNMTDEEIEELKEEIINARRKYSFYILPLKIKKESKNKYNLLVKCPYCKENINYKNCLIENKFHYAMHVSCRKCHMRFFVVSRLYKIGVDYYNELDFFRKNYLSIKDNLLKKRI